MNQTTRSLCDFLDASPTAFHAADNIKASLSAHGAIALDEREEWQLEPGVAYFVGRGSSSVIAFRPGMKTLGQSGYVLVCAHTDSPALKARPDSQKAGQNMLRIPVDVYGDAIVSGWLDRPLALAGRLVLRDGGGIRELLYNSETAVGVIPNVAIHLNRDINKGMEYNPHQHLPVFVECASQDAGAELRNPSWVIRRVAADLDTEPENILATDLFFYDCQKALALGSARQASDFRNENELINASRLDDLAGCHAILEAFCASRPALHSQVACFLEAEEIGSMTAQGAASSFARDILARVNIAMKAPAEDFYRAGSRSLCLSFDAAQAWNPAYPEKYDERFSPLLGMGPAIKVNTSQKYATDVVSESLVRLACEAASIPCQKYMVRPDMQSGTTIGPISASRLGVRTIDIGHPLLAMHAVRETVHGRDHRCMIEVAGSFLRELPTF